MNNYLRYLYKIAKSVLKRTKVALNRLVTRIIDEENSTIYPSKKSTFQKNSCKIQERQDRDKNRTDQPKEYSEVQQIVETKSKQKRDNKRDENEDKIETKTRQEISNISKGKKVVCDPKSRQDRDSNGNFKRKEAKEKPFFQRKKYPLQGYKKRKFSCCFAKHRSN